MVQGNQLSPPKVGIEESISVPDKPEMAMHAEHSHTTVYQGLTECHHFSLQLFM